MTQGSLTFFAQMQSLPNAHILRCVRLEIKANSLCGHSAPSAQQSCFLQCSGENTEFLWL